MTVSKTQTQMHKIYHGH